MNVVSTLIVLVLMLMSLPVIFLWVECMSACIFSRKQDNIPFSLDIEETDVAILMPAHNEAQRIGETLNQLKPSLRQNYQLIVIADNCTDNTATIARSFNVTVLERFNKTNIGKGHALAHALSMLKACPPEIVVVIDSDCFLKDGSLEKIIYLSKKKNRPVQGKYLMVASDSSSPKTAISLLAFMVKNEVRLLGTSVLGLPSVLAGTGMAFPWSVINSVPVATSNIVEDMQLGIDLAIAGYPPLFCRQSEIFSRIPDSNDAATTQRTRWEHGHLSTIRTQIPKLMRLAFLQRRLDLLAMALDLLIPPLSLLMVLWMAMALITIGMAIFFNMYIPIVISLVEGGLLLTAILGSWFKFGKEIVSARGLLSIPLYILQKIPIYFKFLGAPQKQWVRTPRSQQ